MAKEAQETTTDSPDTAPIDPNIHLFQFLNDFNYELSVDAISSKNPFVEGAGFVLSDKPLLVVKVTKKEVEQ